MDTLTTTFSQFRGGKLVSKYESKLPHPIGFAHRGAKAHARENTLEAFLLAVKLGASGIESDVWVTADGHVVMDHDGTVGSLWRKRAIGQVKRADLPEHIPSLAEYYQAVGTEFPLSLDLKDPDALLATVEVARAHGAEDQLWLCHYDVDVLIPLRSQTTAKLVDSTRLRKIDEGPERRAAKLRDSGIDALNMHHTDWNAGLVAMVHRFERFALGWDAQHPRQIGELVRMGIDGVFSDHVDRLMSTIEQFHD